MAAPIESVFRAVERLTRSGRPVLTRDVARAIHRSSSTVSAALVHLANVGWLVRTEKPGPRGGHAMVYWNLSRKARTEPYAGGLPYTDTPERVMALVIEERTWTIRQLTDTLQRPYETVRRAVQRLVKDGELVQHLDAGRVVVSRPLVELDDEDDWTPQPYINPIRARALGLQTGRAA